MPDGQSATSQPPVSDTLPPMLDNALPILMPLLGIGFVIVIHELGHYLAAKWAGVRVHTFSLGFGPVILRKTVGETDYVLSLLPFGGYVAMQEESDGSGRSMQEVSAGWQAVILFAGVFFNLVSSFLLLLCLAWYGMPHIPPVVGAIHPEVRSANGELVPSPAERLGLLSGDRVLSINGEAVRTFDGILVSSIAAGNEDLHLVIERRGQRLDLPAPGQPRVQAIYDREQGRPLLGFEPAKSNLVQVAVGPGTEDLGSGWKLLAVDGIDTTGTWEHAFDGLLRERLGQEVVLRLGRGEETKELRGVWTGSPGEAHQVASGWPTVLGEIMPGPGSEAGLRTGDVVLAVDGNAIGGSGELRGRIARSAGAPVRLDLRRRDPSGHWTTQSITVQARHDERTGRPLIGMSMGLLGIGVMQGLRPDLPLTQAGLADGDAVLAMADIPRGKELPQKEPSPFALLRLPPGQDRLIPLADADWQRLRVELSPSVFVKFLGVDADPSVVSKLAGARILGRTGTGDTEVLRTNTFTLGEDGVQVIRAEHAIAVAALPAAVQEALRGLAVGEWIADTEGIDHEGRRCLVVRAGLDLLEPQRLVVTPRTPGLALAFRMEEVPYPLTSWTDAFGLAGWRSMDMVVQTGRILSSFFKSAEAGGVDASKSLHGPIGIFTELKARQEHSGFASFLNLVAMLGLNLFIINLLPIPIADGGRLLLVGIEAVMRRPVPARAVNLLNNIGLLAIIGLMLFVVGVDILRVMGRH